MGVSYTKKATTLPFGNHSLYADIWNALLRHNWNWRVLTDANKSDQFGRRAPQLYAYSAHTLYKTTQNLQITSLKDRQHVKEGAMRHFLTFLWTNRHNRKSSWEVGRAMRCAGPRYSLPAWVLWRNVNMSGSDQWAGMVVETSSSLWKRQGGTFGTFWIETQGSWIETQESLHPKECWLFLNRRSFGCTDSSF